MQTSSLARALLASTLALAGSAAAPLDAAAPTQAGGEAGGSLVVNGVEIPELAVRRALVYREGRNKLHFRKVQILIDQEVRRRIDAGADPAEFRIPDAEIEAIIGKSRAQIKDTYEGTLTEEQVLANNELTLDTWRSQTAQTLLFNKVFLPDNPEEWPEITRKALESSMGEAGEEFLARMQEGHDQRVAEGKEVDPTDPSQMIFKRFLSQTILGSLEKDAEVLTAADGIPAEVAMIVNGEEITTDAIFAEIEDKVAPIDWQRTRIWLAKITAVEQELKRSGHWLDDEAFEAIFAAQEAQYAESPLQLPVLVLNFKKFPSMDAYRSYYRAMESYRVRIADEITDESLAGHMERANRLLGLEKVDCEVILLSAYDLISKRWKEDGWEDAAERAREVVRRLSEGEDWDALLEEYSDFWDPPVTPSQAGTPPTAFKRKGRFGPVYRNDLITKLDESEYLIFLTGTSVADYVFFDQEAGTYAGPFRGSQGYYITKVNSRTPPMRTLSLDVENERKLIEQDYLSMRFNAFAKDVVEAARVSGI